MSFRLGDQLFDAAGNNSIIGEHKLYNTLLGRNVGQSTVVVFYDIQKARITDHADSTVVAALRTDPERVCLSCCKRQSNPRGQ